MDASFAEIRTLGANAIAIHRFAKMRDNGALTFAAHPDSKRRDSATAGGASHVGHDSSFYLGIVIDLARLLEFFRPLRMGSFFSGTRIVDSESGRTSPVRWRRFFSIGHELSTAQVFASSGS